MRVWGASDRSAVTLVRSRSGPGRAGWDLRPLARPPSGAALYSCIEPAQLTNAAARLRSWPANVDPGPCPRPPTILPPSCPKSESPPGLPSNVTLDGGGRRTRRAGRGPGAEGARGRCLPRDGSRTARGGQVRGREGWERPSSRRESERGGGRRSGERVSSVVSAKLS